MANKKGGGPATVQSHAAAETSHVESDLQVHREETAAQFLVMQGSVATIQGTLTEV